MLQKFNKFKFRLSSPLRLGVLFILVIIGLQIISPVSFFVTPTAEAQGGMSMVVVLLMQMLIQLFQGGGTPQTGSVEEQPPYYAAVIPTNSPYAYATPNTLPTETPRPALCEKSIFLAEEEENYLLKPDNISVNQEECVNFVNSTANDQTTRIYKDNAKTAVEQKIGKEDAFIFRFINKGTFKFCIKGNGSSADYCGTTVTVGGN